MTATIFYLVRPLWGFAALYISVRTFHRHSAGTSPMPSTTNTAPPYSPTTIQRRSRPVIPLAVWLCEPRPEELVSEPIGDVDGIPQALLHRVISVFSKTGERIVLAGDQHPFLASVAGSITDRPVTLTAPSAATHRDVRGEIGLDQPGQGDHALVAAVQTPDQVAEPNRYQGWAQLLRPGGVLVVVTANAAGVGTFRNQAGAVITAAQRAGLSYLQHIIAVAAHVQGDRLLVPTRKIPPEQASQPAMIHVPAHHDLLAFTTRQPTVRNR